MKQKYTQKQKEAVIQCYLSGEGVLSIHKRTGISRSTIYDWIKAHEYGCKVKDHIVNLKDYNNLSRKYERSQTIIKILQTAPCCASNSIEDKYAAIESMRTEGYNVNVLCAALCLPKGTYYNRKLRGKNGNTQAKQRRDALKPVIEKIFNDSKQIYGAGKITAILKDRGYHTSCKTVAAIMHENGWFSIRTSAKTLYLQNKQRRENILNQEFNPTAPNEVWVSDVTYFKLNHKTFYICVIIDLFARKVLACRISLKNSTQLTKSTFKIAYESRNVTGDLLFHTDNGSNYTSKTFMKYLNGLGVTQSFSRKSLPYDNSVCESFFGNMKREELYRTNYRSEAELKVCIKRYIEFYNSERPHSVLRYRTPDKVETDFFSNHPEYSFIVPDTDGSNETNFCICSPN